MQELGIGRGVDRGMVLATDVGQPDSPLPADGLERYAAGMLTNRSSAAEVRRMVTENARGLLDV